MCTAPRAIALEQFCPGSGSDTILSFTHNDLTLLIRNELKHPDGNRRRSRRMTAARRGGGARTPQRITWRFFRALYSFCHAAARARLARKIADEMCTVWGVIVATSDWWNGAAPLGTLLRIEVLPGELNSEARAPLAGRRLDICATSRSVETPRRLRNGRISGAAVPERLGDAGAAVLKARHDEEQIG